MAKTPPSPEELWKLANYHAEIKKHSKCEGRPYFGNPLWDHIKKCGAIPEPKITAVKIRKVVRT